jgi:phosphate transport system protein
MRQLTVRGFEVAQMAANAVGETLGNGDGAMLNSVRQYEEELDSLDRRINEGVTAAISRVPEAEARELLSYLKFIIELERVGDLLLNLANRLSQVSGRIAQHDVNELRYMAGLLQRMLTDAAAAFAERDLNRSLAVLRADAEMDRLRNLMFVRHIDNPENQPRSESFHLVFMAQTLERAGDHCKNMAEEVCYLVTGRSVRHLLRAADKSFEEMFVDWVRRRELGR